MSLNIDNYMDDLISKYSEDDIKDALTRAKKRADDKTRDAEITGKRSKVLAALNDYLITVFGKVDQSLIKEFEKELITIEKKSAGTSDEPKKKVKTYVCDNVTDDEKLRKFIDELFKY